MLVINCYGKDPSVRLKTHLNTEGLKTITLSRAIIPLAYFNISDKLRNNRLRYLTGEKEGDRPKVFTLTVRNGLYTVESLNDEIQRVLVRNGHKAGYITISYVEARGRINLNVKKPYILFLDGPMTDILGLPTGYYPSTEGKDVDVRGTTECRLTRITEYRISCNLVDKDKNFYNGVPSDLIAIIQPKGGQYGDSLEYRYGFQVPVKEAGFSEILIKICDQNMEEIRFQEAVQILLTLE